MKSLKALSALAVLVNFSACDYYTEYDLEDAAGHYIVDPASVGYLMQTETAWGLNSAVWVGQGVAATFGAFPAGFTDVNYTYNHDWGQVDVVLSGGPNPSPFQVSVPSNQIMTDSVYSDYRNYYQFSVMTGPEVVTLLSNGCQSKVTPYLFVKTYENGLMDVQFQSVLTLSPIASNDGAPNVSCYDIMASFANEIGNAQINDNNRLFSLMVTNSAIALGELPGLSTVWVSSAVNANKEVVEKSRSSANAASQASLEEVNADLSEANTGFGAGVTAALNDALVAKGAELMAQ